MATLANEEHMGQIALRYAMMTAAQEALRMGKRPSKEELFTLALELKDEFEVSCAEALQFLYRIHRYT